MRWIAISGSWRKFNEQVEKDVRETVREIIVRGDGIVSGGALGVDYFATDEAMKQNPEADKIKIFLPVTLEIYAMHYRKRADEGVINHEQFERLVAQLSKLKEINPNALIENHKHTIVDKEAYYERNNEVILAADTLEAFQVNGSLGTQDAIDKALARGIKVNKREYVID